MAGIKRRLAEDDAINVKEAKVQLPGQHSNPVKTGKGSKIRKSALPSPDDSSTSNKDLISTPSTEESYTEVPKNVSPASKKKLLTSGGNAKASTSAQRQEGLLNGVYLGQRFA